jgi:hypothetical protein
VITRVTPGIVSRSQYAQDRSKNGSPDHERRHPQVPELGLDGLEVAGVQRHQEPLERTGTFHGADAWLQVGADNLGVELGRVLVGLAEREIAGRVEIVPQRDRSRRELGGNGKLDRPA